MNNDCFLCADDNIISFIYQRHSDTLHLLAGDFLQMLLRRLAVDDIDHDLFRPQLRNGAIPCLQLLRCGVIYDLSVMRAA